MSERTVRCVLGFKSPNRSDDDVMPTMLNPRQKTVLFQTIREFVSTGEPVSSGSVVRSGVLSVSSATVRNVMSELENLGYLAQPHTSAGRVPTPHAFRLFVNDLDVEGDLEAAQGVDQAMGHLLAQRSDLGLGETARRVSTLLSQLSDLTSLVSTPTLHNVRLRDIHLSVLSGNRVLVMLVTDDERVHHRIIPMTQDIEPQQLKRMENVLGELAVGHTLDEIRTIMLTQRGGLIREIDDMVPLARRLGAQAFDVAAPQVHVEGALNFFNHAEFSADTSRLKEILNLLTDHDRLMPLLDDLCGPGDAPMVLIGPELQFDGSKDISLIICGYGREGEPLGVVGLMGPMRMNYARIISLVSKTAQALSDALKEPS